MSELPHGEEKTDERKRKENENSEQKPEDLPESQMMRYVEG
jgi:hypothetical protein